MDSTTQRRTASTVLVIAGLWVLISPLFVDMSDAAMWNAVISGILLAATGFSQMFVRSGLPSVIGIVLGIWVFISAFLFDQSTAAMWNLLAVGIVGFLASVWDETTTISVDQPRMTRST